MSETATRPLPGLGQEVEVDDIAGALSAAEWDFSAQRARQGAHGFVLASGRGVVRLKSRPETLLVSQPFMTLFRNM